MASLLRFVLEGEGLDIRTMHERFLPNGSRALNSVMWRDKEPRSCVVTGIGSGPMRGAGFNAPYFKIEVTYREDGHVTYDGHRRFDGWTAMVPRRDSDGVLIDESGAPLADGAPPFLVPEEVYGETDFNDIDFGRFIDEVEIETVQHKSTLEEALEGSVGVATRTRFVAPRRSRPLVKVVLSSAPTCEAIDQFGTRILNVDNTTSHLEFTLTQTFIQLMCEFIEGKVSLPVLENESATFVGLNKVLVDCGPNEDGLDSLFGVLHFHTPAGFLDDLAKRLMALYEVDVTVVEGDELGLLLRREGS